MDIVRRYKPASEIICYPPKKLIHTWSGHEKGVNKVELFPRYGHLLLSAANDGMVKIWDVYNSKKCMMTYHGHTLGVRDASFSNDGRQFLSAAFDRNVRLWDTETGKCISTFTTGKVPYVARFYPKNNNEFLAGQGDKKIIQWDIRENKIVQEYDRHLGTVNSITFVDDDRRFLTTSDDKSIRVWDYGFSVDIKLIAEPHMHSMPAVTKHPNGT
jgi:pre-mRNA-processing factor 17